MKDLSVTIYCNIEQADKLSNIFGVRFAGASTLPKNRLIDEILLTEEATAAIHEAANEDVGEDMKAFVRRINKVDKLKHKAQVATRKEIDNVLKSGVATNV